MGDKYESSPDRPPSLCLLDNTTDHATDPPGANPSPDPSQDPTGHSCNTPGKGGNTEDEGVKWKEVWFEFTQSTSFHGVCQVAEPQPFLARRFIWFLIFLGGTIVFLIHSGFSIEYYFQWPVSVDVQIHYNKTIQFPAITICNENAFRATEAYYLDQYDVITELFTQHREGATEVRFYNASDITLEELYMNTRHRKEDLIFKCEWDSSPCSADDFSTTFTDFGVCYTFNGAMDGKAERVASQTGARGGLRLQLNIEQYEYMRGPNDGAGVKLLVHEPHDVPLVKDHGLAVPSGMHAFVALEILEVHNLKPPHGKCNDSVVLEHFPRYTMATCSVNCKQKHLIEKCGCRDIYMLATKQQHMQQQQQQQGQEHHEKEQQQRQQQDQQDQQQQQQDQQQQQQKQHQNKQQQQQQQDEHHPQQQHQQQQQQQQQQQNHTKQYKHIPYREKEIPVCDLDTFQDCMIPQLDHFHKLDDECECPVPCSRVLYEPRVSYVSTSNFDTDSLLGSDVTEILEERYIRAREASQRTQRHVVRRHNHVVRSVRNMAASIDHVFREVTRSIEAARSELHQTMETMKRRVNFHLHNGLNNVDFVLQHNFIRGWQVYEERVLNYVSSDFLNIPASVERTLQWMNHTMDPDNVVRKSDAWWPVQNLLEGKLMLVKRARANITTAHEAYLTGNPLLTFEVTVDEHYDMSYISLELLQKGARRQQEYFGKLMKDLDILEEALSRMIKIGETCVRNSTFIGEEFVSAANLYYKGSRGYNYHLFLFKDRIVLKPLQYIRKRIDKFMNANQTMMLAYADLISGMDIVVNLIQTTNHSHWKDVQVLMQEAVAYETDTTRNKTYLAKLATSQAMEEGIRQIKIEFAALRSRAQELGDNWRRMTHAYQHMWVTMLSETSTKAFYAQLHNDWTVFAKNSMAHVFHRYFASLLALSREKIATYDPNELGQFMNADFHGINLTSKLIQIDSDFLRMENSCRITNLLGDKDETFLQSFETLQTSLKTFLDQNVIDQKFYKENFLQLDVFMKELSYEEIVMQPAYDLPQLLGDIGGSMGLFIGGSALSVFEFMDIILHNGARIIFNK